MLTTRALAAFALLEAVLIGVLLVNRYCVTLTPVDAAPAKRRCRPRKAPRTRRLPEL